MWVIKVKEAGGLWKSAAMKKRKREATPLPYVLHVNVSIVKSNVTYKPEMFSYKKS